VLNFTGQPRSYDEILVHQLKATMMSSSSKTQAVSIYKCDLVRRGEAEANRAIKELTEFAATHGDQLHIVIDGAVFDHR
jgi:hypothetical protein